MAGRRMAKAKILEVLGRRPFQEPAVWMAEMDGGKMWEIPEVNGPWRFPKSWGYPQITCFNMF